MDFGLTNFLNRFDDAKSAVYARKRGESLEIPSNIKRLTEMAKKGYSLSEIAEEADGVAKTQMHHLLTAAGIRTRHQFADNPEDIEFILEAFYEEGLTASEITDLVQADPNFELDRPQYVSFIINWPVQRFVMENEYGVDVQDDPDYGSSGSNGGPTTYGFTGADELPERLK